MKKYKVCKKISIYLIFIMLFQVISPGISYALTSGPSQPEVQSFEPVGTSQMVDLFSGDFNYNIPLLEVGGYPINIAYHAGVGMEQEASWVGLGWNLNPGAVNRNMRGIPDDFSGEIVNKEVHRKDNVSVSFVAKPDFELVGLGVLNAAIGIRNNSYKGLSILGSANIGLDIIDMGAFGLNANLGVDLENGISLSPSLSSNFSISKKKNINGKINIGAPYNSRQGLSELSFTKGFSKTSFEASSKALYKSTYGVSINSTLATFNTPSYITSTDFDSDAFSFSLNLALGGELPFTNIEGSILGSYSRHTTNGRKNLRSFGYMNHHLANPKLDLLDFNREHDGPYFEGTNVLPLTNLTNDVFGISGQGMGGVFRGFRNQISYVTDPATYTTSAGGTAGADIGIIAAPVTFKGGGNLAVHILNSESGLWDSENSAISKYNTQAQPSSTLNQALFEPTYLKQLGELSSDKGRYNNLGGAAPLAFDINQHVLTTNIRRPDNSIVSEVEEERATRNQLTFAKSFRDAIIENRFRTVKNYLPGLDAQGNLAFNDINIFDYQTALNVNNTQVFEYSVLRPDGMRYVYGQPAYNLVKEEAIFNAPGNTPLSGGLIAYNNGDLQPGNGNGIDEFVSREVLPAYTYSHLLTEVLSSDYSDLTGDGPTDDDYGSWVKFNYNCQAGPLATDQENYKWRFPYAINNNSFSGNANFNEGLKSRTLDDKANYTYGEKELWFLHSIESRTHIAVFHTSPRADAKGVDNNFGTTSGVDGDPGRNQRLDRIDYYAKNDLADQGNNAIPLKSVHFDYDYSLCQDVPNNFNSGSDDGKLTLKSLHFTYGNSLKGQFSKYEFDYDQTYNYVYNKKAQDRWGCYKAEPAGINYDPSQIANNDPLSNSDFPYAEQNEALADDYARAWNLSTITLPSGGTIDIEYESDDYAFVQDKRAGQMFNLVGLSQDEPTSLTQVNDNLIIQSGGILNYEFNNYLVVQLDNNTTTQTLDRDAFFNSYLEDIGKLYFRALVNIEGGDHEFVPGYANVENYGTFFQNGQGNFGWIKLKGVDFDENDSNGVVNPIAKAAWQFARLQMPELVYPGSNFDDNAFEKFIKSIAGIFTKEIPRMINGFNKSLRNEGYAKNLVPEKSWIRLNNPTYHKKGGGCRVSKISMSDEWSAIKGEMTNEDDASYGQQYFYEKLITTSDGQAKTVSSGVASYEPMLGNDENPFKQPIVTSESRLLAPDNEHYIERPLGESFYPSGTVGYSQVVVADIRPEGSSTRTATGYSVNEFYTAQDFPYQTQVNEGEFYKDEPGLISKIFKFRSKDYVTASKGYSIILNDMHGKPKATWAYGGFLPITGGELELDETILNNENKISGQEYLYRLDDNNQLDNEVEAITPEGNVSTATIGIESEMAMDFREHYSKATRVEVQGNVDTWVIPFPFFPPLVIPTVWGNFSDETTRFRSAVATKLVNQHGLIDKVRVFDQGAIIETQNLLYDAQTGEVLLTSVNNEFRDKIDDVDPVASEENILYNMKYPAHWAYDGMQHAYQNIGVEADITVTSNGSISIQNADDLFYPGDEVAALGLFFTNGGFPNIALQKFWVSEVNASSIKLIDRNGQLFTSDFLYFGVFDTGDNWNIKVVRSGYRNQQSIPIANMASLKNPADEILEGNTSGNDPLTSQASDLEILDFSAQEFGSVWESFCGTEGLDSQLVDVDLEICTECADIAFVIDISGSVSISEFESMKNHILATIEALDGQMDGNYRYSIVYFHSSAEVLIPFTADAEEASNFDRDYQNFGTNLNNSLDDVIGFINDSTLLPRDTCPLNLAIFTDANPGEIFPYVHAQTLKENFDAVLSMVRYRQGDNAAGDAEGASTASPGWDYLGPVADNGHDWQITPRRFIPTSFGAVLPNIASNLSCYDTTIQEVQVSPILCGVNEGDIVNPFVNGIWGNWRPTKSYVHNHVPRVQAPINGPDGADIANKGYYSEYDQFWNKPTGSGFWTPDPSNYITTAEVTKYNPYGEALENQDALGIYSAALLGYDKKLAIAMGSNTKYQEMAFDGFEEYDYYIDPSICHANYHLDLDAADFITTDEAHTGLYSFRVDPNTTESRSLVLNCYSESPPNSYTTTPYQIDKCEDCLTTFNPVYRTEAGAENRYVFDAWVKEGDASNSITIGVKPLNGTEITYNFEPKGPVIDGWQRIYEFFELEPNTELINISFNNTGASNPMHIDDIRFYPFDANMKSFVYHPSSLKLMAELDENNHATLFEYDDEWNLVRVKKETERGIMTIQENRSNTRLNRN